MYRYAIGVLLGVALLFSAGAFAHFAYSGPSEPTVQPALAPPPTPYVSPCDRLRDRAMLDNQVDSREHSNLRGLGCVTQCPPCTCD
jgi:hypothetical protein